jgi:hypothetical protein
LQFVALIIFVVVFNAEVVIKLIVLGLLPTDPGSYFRDPWNWLDFVISIEMLISVSGIFDTKLGALRTIRALRPLKTIGGFSGLRNVVTGLVACVPSSHLTFLALFCAAQLLC